MAFCFYQMLHVLSYLHMRIYKHGLSVYWTAEFHVVPVHAHLRYPLSLIGAVTPDCGTIEYDGNQRYY